MFLKESIDKSVFELNGYVILDTSLSENQSFNNLIKEMRFNENSRN